jgi:hypothetical protein
MMSMELWQPAIAAVECDRPAIVVDHSLPGERITRELDAVVAERGAPRMIVIDNGPELLLSEVDRKAR